MPQQIHTKKSENYGYTRKMRYNGTYTQHITPGQAGHLVHVSYTKNARTLLFIIYYYIINYYYIVLLLLLRIKNTKNILILYFKYYNYYFNNNTSRFKLLSKQKKEQLDINNILSSPLLSSLVSPIFQPLAPLLNLYYFHNKHQKQHGWQSRRRIRCIYRGTT